MEQELLVENAQLKEIIRENDRRIYYLETKIKAIIEKNEVNVCYLCTKECDYDEEPCDCNIFCTYYLCRNCVKLPIKNGIQCCYVKCKKWYCNISVKSSLNIVCNYCKKVYCAEHIQYNICGECNIKNKKTGMSIDEYVHV